VRVHRGCPVYRWRIASRLAASEVATRLGITPDELDLLEHGDITPDSDLEESMARVCGILPCEHAAWLSALRGQFCPQSGRPRGVPASRAATTPRPAPEPGHRYLTQRAEHELAEHELAVDLNV